MAYALPLERSRPVVSHLRVAIIVLLAVYNDEFIASLIGMTGIQMQQTFALAIFVMAGAAAVIGLGTGKLYRQPYSLWPIGLLLLFFLVSFYSNSFIYPKPVGEWLPSLYEFFPILLVYPLWFLGTTEREVFDAIVWCGVLSIVILITDSYVHFAFLADLTRDSHFDPESRRIVILKYELCIATLFFFSRLWDRSLGLAKAILYLTLLGAALYVQANIVESRLAVLTVVVGFILLTLLRKPHRSLGTSLRFIVLSSFGLVAGVYLFHEYLMQLTSDRLLVGKEYMVTVRIESFNYFWDRFLETYGVGFGMMSKAGTINNIIRPVQGWNGFVNYNFVDLGMYAALLQFGVLGLLLIGFLTLSGVVVFYRAFRVLPESDRWRPAVLLAFLVGSLLSPIPINLFSLPFSMFEGALILFFLSQYSQVLRAAAANR